MSFCTGRPVRTVVGMDLPDKKCLSNTVYIILYTYIYSNICTSIRKLYFAICCRRCCCSLLDECVVADLHAYVKVYWLQKSIYCKNVEPKEIAIYSLLYPNPTHKTFKRTPPTAYPNVILNTIRSKQSVRELNVC